MYNVLKKFRFLNTTHAYKLVILPKFFQSYYWIIVNLFVRN